MRAFVDEPIVDIERARTLATTAAARWDLGEPRLLRQSMCAIFEAGGVVIRVSRPNAPATALLDLATVLASSDVRVPQPIHHDTVSDGELVATAWEWIAAIDDSIDWGAVGAMVRRVHAIDRAEIPAEMPSPSPSAFPWWKFDDLFAATAPLIDQRARDGLEAVIEKHRGWDEFGETVVCHGDVHPGNVIMSATGPVLIDWDLLCVAPPGWDHGPLMTWTERWGGEPGTYEAFASGYGWSARLDPAATSFAELRLVAATLMRVQAAQRNPAAAVEAEARLRYWRGDPQAPPWQAQ